MRIPMMPPNKMTPRDIFSDKELQEDEKEEVTDDDFFNLLNQNILENDPARK
jgi:hypothetical protein